MSTALQDFRARFPQYNDRDDEELAEALYTKYYSDMPRTDYRRRMGLPDDSPPAPPTISERVDSQIHQRVQAQDPLVGQRVVNDMLDLARDPGGELQTYFADVSEANERGLINNSVRLAAERGSSLLGHATSFVGKAGAAIEEKAGTGQIVFGSDWGPDDPADGKFRVRYMNAKEFDQFERDHETANILTQTVPDYLQSRDFGGISRHTTEAIKRAYADGEIVGTIGATLAFGLEQGIQSIPDMLAVMSGLPGLAAYVGARSDEIGDVRAEHKGKVESDFQDNLEALPFALGSALFERFGAGAIVKAFGKNTAEQVGQELLEAGLKAAATRVAGRTAVAAGTEAGTEAFQEGVLEYLGEKLGTDAPLTWEEGLERGFFGALGGMTFGGAAGGTLAVAGESVRMLDSKLVDQMATAQADELAASPEGDVAAPVSDPTVIPDTDFDAAGNIVTIDPEFDQGPKPPGVDEITEAEAESSTPDPGPAPDLEPAPPPDVPRETPTEPSDESTATAGEPETFDPRMKRDVYRVNLAGMADELVQGGGVTYIRDENDVITGRTPSENPSWFQSLAGTEAAMSVKQVRNAVEKALQGRPLGVRQARVIQVMLDTVMDERTQPPNMDYARQMLEHGRELRREARNATELAPVDIYDDIIGEMLEEADYLPEMDGEARVLMDLSAIADTMDPERVSVILEGADSNQEAIIGLERFLNDNQVDFAGIEAAQDQERARAPVEVPPEGAETDLLGDDTAAAQAVADEQARRDAARDTGQDSLETGDPSDLFSAARDQVDLVDELARPVEGELIEADVERRRDRQERRIDTARRERVAGLSLDDMVDELYTDPITGLGNRRAFEEQLEHAEAVGSIDIDGLGGVNDNLGHSIGDALIRAVGEALAATEADAFHISGDEFYVLGDTEAEVANAINRAKQTLARQVLEAPRGKVTGIDITTGVAGNKTDADTQMEDSKKKKEAAGTRAPKGQLPRGGVLYSARPLDMNPGTNYVGIIGRHGDLPMDENHNYMLGNGRKVRIPEKPVRRKHIMDLLQRKFGIKIFQGRVKGRTKLGFYRPGHGEIRVKNQNDLEVTAHEVSHWLDDRHPWIGRLYQQYRHEILQVSYDDKLDYEGYAEFMRLWFTQEHEARERAPGFYDAWMAELETHPGIKSVAFELQELMHAWHLQGARKRLEDRYGKQDVPLYDRIRERLDGIQDKALQKLFDELRPFKEIERKVRGKVARVAFSGYKSLRLARGSHAVMQSIFWDATINWSEDGDIVKTGNGLKPIFDQVSDRMVEMQNYMVARRAEELTEQGRENHVRPDEIERGLRFGKDDPQLAEVFDEWLEFNARMFDFYESSGIMGSEQRAAIEEMNKNYVPFNRIVDTLLGHEVKKGGGSPFMRLKGGTGNINDIFDSIVGNTAHLVHMSLVNVGKRNFYQMLDNADNQTAGLYAAPVGRDVKPTKIQRDQVIKTVIEGMGLSMSWYRMAKTGLVGSDAEASLVVALDQMAKGLEPMVLFFQTGIEPSGDLDYYFRDGKKVFYEIIDQRLMEAIEHMGPRSHNLAANILGGFANVLRRGITLTPRFQAKNFIRDTMNAFTLSKGQMVPVAAATKALLERLYNDSHYWDYMRNGGGFASMADADGINRDRIMDGSRKLFRLLDTGLATAEYANRIAEFKALRQKGWNARDAALAGREISTDFAMRGSSEILRWFTLSVPFMNARLQGLYRNGRELASMEEGKVKFAGAQAFSYALRSLTAITIPTLILYALNKDDERYQELPDYVRDLSWVIFTGEGEDDYVMIPKPFETGTLWGTIPERMIEYYYKNDEAELADAMLWMFVSTFSMNPVPQAFKVWDDLAKNKNFTGAPIMPNYLEDVEPMEQYRAYTSDAMIALGRKMNISPIKAEYIVRGHFGEFGIWALGLADMLVGDVNNSGAQPTRKWSDNLMVSPFVDDGPLRRTHSEDHLYDMLNETQEIANTVRIISNRAPDRIEQYISEPRRQIMTSLNDDLKDWSKQMRELNNAIDIITADPDLSGDEKRATIFELRRVRNEISRAVRDNINPELVQQLVEEAEAAELASRRQAVGQ